MAMLQRDYTIEAIKRLDALIEYAVMHTRLRRRRQGARRSVVSECVSNEMCLLKVSAESGWDKFRFGM